MHAAGVSSVNQARTQTECEMTGEFRPITAVPSAEVLDRQFRHKVLRLLQHEGAIGPDVVGNLPPWKHTGFGADVGLPQPGSNREHVRDCRPFGLHVNKVQKGSPRLQQRLLPEEVVRGVAMVGV